MQSDRFGRGWNTPRQRRYRAIAETLREAILSGEFASGARLPTERDLAAQFGVSRSCIREALLALEIHDLVHIKVGSGVYVTEGAESLAGLGAQKASEPSVAHILNARLMFEPEICAAAAAQADRDDVANLRAQHEARTREILDIDAAARNYRDFHLALARLTRNPLAHGVILGIWQATRARPDREALRALLQAPERQSMWRNDHASILDALAAAHRGEARAAMRRHLENVISCLDDAGHL